MTIRVAINGYGRIGRCILRAIFESKKQNEFEIVAINDLSAIDTTAHLTRYDTTHGRFASDVSVEGVTLIIDGHAITIIGQSNATHYRWREKSIDFCPRKKCGCNHCLWSKPPHTQSV